MRKLDERAEALIQEGLQHQQEIEIHKARLEAITKQLAAYFPGASEVEHLPTVEGTAIRVLDERIEVNPLTLPNLMADLESQFVRYFHISMKAVPTQIGKAMLSSADNPLRYKVRPHLIVRSGWVLHFSPSKLGRVINLTPEELP